MGQKISGPSGQHFESACRAHAARELMRLVRLASGAADRLFAVGGPDVITTPAHLRTEEQTAALAAWVVAENAAHDYRQRIGAIDR